MRPPSFSPLFSYDHDGDIPLFGFGASVDHQPTSHCFPLDLQTGNADVAGIEGALSAYEHAVRSGRLRFSGPTNLSEIINTATAIAAKDGEISQCNQYYSIMMILTDGVITDMEQTIDAIVRAARHGLSIIIVGIGVSKSPCFCSWALRCS
tara:strand:- start:5 stop:457 length:453 start_codon:yes stop_codon:yes gene_type:complete